MDNALKKLLLLFYGCWIAITIAGVIAYPASPIRPEGATFVDKLGKPHTLKEYQNFQLWERSYIVVAGIVVMLAFASAIQRYRQTGSFGFKG